MIMLRCDAGICVMSEELSADQTFPCPVTYWQMRRTERFQSVGSSMAFCQFSVKTPSVPWRKVGSSWPIMLSALGMTR